MARKHLNMTRDEFLYQHDALAISTMLAQVFKTEKEHNAEGGNFGEDLASNIL